MLLLGVLLAVTIILLTRGSTSWPDGKVFTELTLMQWLSIALCSSIGLLIQYYVIFLVRHTHLKVLVFWLLPGLWFFNNILVAMHRFLDWTTEIASDVGWFTLADLVSWMLSAVYFPILIAAGAVAAILDETGGMLSQACYFARIALDVASISPWQFIDFSLNLLGILWDLLSNTFVQEVMEYNRDVNSLFEFSIVAAFSFPKWLTTLGYSLACLCL